MFNYLCCGLKSEKICWSFATSCTLKLEIWLFRFIFISFFCVTTAKCSPKKKYRLFILFYFWNLYQLGDSWAKTSLKTCFYFVKYGSFCYLLSFFTGLNLVLAGRGAVLCQWLTCSVMSACSRSYITALDGFHTFPW